MRLIAVVLMLLILAIGHACTNSEALPHPVVFTPASGTPVAALDPELEPLPGAEAHFGELNGGKYRVEIPDDWNARLVIVMRGSKAFGDEAFEVDPPIHREWLIANGYAWAASSYDREDFITGAAADQSAALWDYFAREFGRPELTFAAGHSMGGAAALISAERYPDRYDGAISACGVSGHLSHFDVLADFMAAAVYAAELEPADVLSYDIADALSEHIIPRLEAEPTRLELLENIWISLSGGTRPYGAEGFRLRERALWGLSFERAGLYSNLDRVYSLDESVGIDSDELNQAAIRFPVTVAREEIPPTEEITGAIEIPVVILHTTGDGIVPLSEVHYVQTKVAEAGRSHLLDVRLIEHPEHCGFTTREYVQAFELLVKRVESFQ